MAEGDTRVAQIRSALARLGYRLRNLLARARPIHLVVTGPDDRCAEMLAQRLAASHLAKRVSYVAGSALSVPKLRGDLIVSCDPEDVMKVGVISQEWGGLRHLLFLFVTADPRQLVSEVSPVLPHHFTQGADYRLRVGPGPTRSLTGPGVLPRLTAVYEALSTPGVKGVMVSRDDFLNRPAVIPEQLDNLLADKGLSISTNWGLAFEDDREVNELREEWAKSTTRRARVNQQVERFPELEEVARRLGYPSLTTPRATQRPEAPGTIIAFHTPDEVYRAEAERLKKSLDALGLTYQIFEIEPEKNWVRTTLLKPTWIAPVRDNISGPLLYIDVDAFVHEDPWPFLADVEGDMGAVVYENGQLNSATLWINDTPGARTILERWAEAAHERRRHDVGDLLPTGENGDQGVLRFVVEAEEELQQPAFRFARLCPNLATIFDRTDEFRVGPIAIEQLQVSRESTQNLKRLARRRERLAQLGQ